MKKVYLGLSILAFSSAVIAQGSTATAPLKSQLNMSEVKEGKQIYAPYQKASITVWSNDFNTPADWVADNDGQASPFGWTVDATNSGWWSTAGINSTSGGNFAELYNGNPTNNNPAPVGSTFTLTTATSIDVQTLAGSNAVSIQFEQYGARFQDLQEVYVSTDGTTWTLVGDNGDIPAHTAGSSNPYANPMVRKFNIANAIAGNPSTVWLRFSWAPDVQNITYGWYIDDVKIVTNEDYEVDLVSTNFGSTGFWQERLPYYQVPVDQITAIDFSAVIKNIGAMDQTNTALTVDVNAGASSVSSPAGFTSVPGNIDTLVTATFTPTAATVASYAFDMEVASDEVEASPLNNVATASMATTNYIYARDKGTASGSSTNQGDDYEVGNVFDIFADATLQAIQVKVATVSTGNPLIYATIYSIDPTDGSFGFLETSDEHTVTNAERTSGATINLIMQNPVPLTAGSGYLVVVGTYAGTTDYFQVANSGTSAAQTTFLYDGPTTTWFYTTSTPIVRMNFSPAVSVSENEIADATLGQNYPNPTTGNTSIDYTLTSNANVTIEITDLSGKVIEVINEGSRVAGTYTVNLDYSNLSAGTYFYSLTTENGKTTKSMNIIK